MSDLLSLSWDQLGTPRLITDQNGNVVARHDYLPFGFEVPAGSAGRSTQWSLDDSIEQKFTGQRRDQETGEDYFNARYFTSAQGRFNSPDPENAGADLTNPQSWNGYAYVGNNPLNAVDPDGRNLFSAIGSFSGLFGGSGGNTNEVCESLTGGGNCGGGQTISDYRSSIFVDPGEAAASGGTAIFGTVGYGKADVPTESTPTGAPAKNRFTKVFLPPNANVCFDNQNYFYAPPTFDIHNIEAAGKAGGWSPQTMGAAVGHYGTFDFQRARDSAGNTTFYSGYKPVSNFAVGTYLYSAGFSKSVASFIANTFALFRSSNAGDPAQASELQKLGL